MYPYQETHPVYVAKDGKTVFLLIHIKVACTIESELAAAGFTMFHVKYWSYIAFLPPGFELIYFVCKQFCAFVISSMQHDLNFGIFWNWTKYISIMR